MADLQGMGVLRLSWASISLFAWVLLLTGCNRCPLVVRNELLDHTYLASYQIRTPDPRLYCPFCGQQLIVQWSLPPDYLNCPDLHILLQVRFRDAQMDVCKYPIHAKKGSVTYRLINEDYWCHDGILTYRAEVRTGDCVLSTWTHQVWANLIDLRGDDCDECAE